MSDQTFERAALDGKDREQLQAIASAVGVKGVTRLKKADLVEAIVAATGPAPSTRSNGSNGDAPETKRIRSARASEMDTISKLAAEEDSLSGASTDATEALPIIRPRRTADANAAAVAAGPAHAHAHATNGDATATTAGTEQANNGSDNGPGAATTTVPPAATTTSDPTDTVGDSSDDTGDGDSGPQSGWQNDDRRGRRNRRRGRNRERGEMQPDVEPSSYQGDLVDVHGLLDLRDEGYGFLRASGYLPGRNDAYVSASQVRRFALRKGDHVKGATRQASSNEKYPALQRVDLVNGMAPDEARNRARFEDLTPLFPDVKLGLELTDQPLELTGRIVDLVSPIGKGQRGIIVSPPKAGKTTILKQVVYAIERNNPECHVMVLLVDERPEEVTDMKRHVLRAEVISSTFDRPSDEHCHVAELTIERAKRLVEMGQDVVIILDGITRLARAYNLAAPATGRIMSGGIDAGALYPPKKFFGAARNVDEGGSLTIIATALVETNSRMDEHIFEEFKGTGNMELRLDRRLADRRTFPAIDIESSGTRHEELLFDRYQLQQIWKLRRVLAALDSDRGGDGPSGKGMELLIEKLRTTRTNAEFLGEIAKSPAPAI